MILVDTSVWIEHLRERSDRLRTLLFDEQVICHPFDRKLRDQQNLGGQRLAIIVLSSISWPGL